MMLLGGAAGTCPLAARAQQPTRLPRIGFLSPSVQSYQGAFRDGLRSLGYIDGQNIAIAYRFAEGDDVRLHHLAQELVGLDVELIVATNASATQAAMKATATIPIVMVTSGDPLLFVQSLSRPGGNVTGTGWMVPDLSIKQLELLRELHARIGKVAVLWNSANPTHAAFFRQLPEAARILRVRRRAGEAHGHGPEPYGRRYDRLDRVRARPVFRRSRHAPATGLCEPLVEPSAMACEPRPAGAAQPSHHRAEPRPDWRRRRLRHRLSDLSDGGARPHGRRKAHRPQRRPGGGGGHSSLRRECP
jgi:hypothetical protein